MLVILNHQENNKIILSLIEERKDLKLKRNMHLFKECLIEISLYHKI